MKRIHVVGTSGSGKTTLARELSERLRATHVELDAIFHQPGWSPLPEDEFRRTVAGIVADDRWIVDGNYSVVRDLIWERAEVVVWLDLPRATVMRRVVVRTAKRVLTRRELWNTNREQLRNVLDRRPEHNIILWAWRTHGERRRRYGGLMAGRHHAGPGWVRLTTPAEVRGWLAERGDSESR